MKIIFFIITISFGIYLGQKDETPNIHLLRKKLNTCNEKVTTSNVEGSTTVSAIGDCPLVIANAGMMHSLSESESKSKIYNFFNDALKGFYINPNESNVHTNESGPGSSAQKYDPREDLYIRFDKVTNFSKSSNYGVIKDISIVKDKTKCNPGFNQISKDEAIDFIKLLSGKTISYEAQDNGSFSFLFLMTYLFRRDGERDILNRYRLFRNNCSKAVSVILNFCLENPKYDLQYEDMFVTQEGSRGSSSIYCKKSNDKSWTHLSTKYYKLRIDP